MKIGVSGASGKLGSAIIAELRKRGSEHEIVGITRTPEAVSAQAEARFGDYDQPESLAAAYADLDRLMIIPTMDMRPGQRSKQNLTAIDAAVAAGVGHVCFMSSAGTRWAEEPDIWASYFSAEQRLMAKAAKWSILRMNFYIESFVQEVRSSLERGVIAGIDNGKVAYVSRQDLASAAAGLLMGQGFEGAIFTGTGPSSLSGVDRAAAAAAATGKPFEYVSMTEEAFRARVAQAGLPPEIVGAVCGIQSCFAIGGFDIVTGDIEHLSGRAPQSVQDALAAAFAG